MVDASRLTRPTHHDWHDHRALNASQPSVDHNNLRCHHIRVTPVRPPRTVRRDFSLPPPPAAPRRSGWFADRPLTVKFGILLGVIGARRAAASLGSMLVGNSGCDAADESSAHLNQAEELVLQLDTRASELKVDGYKASSGRTPPSSCRSSADDIATPEGHARRAAPPSRSPGRAPTAVAGLADELRRVHRRHHRVRCKAVADQVGSRAAWADIRRPTTSATAPSARARTPWRRRVPTRPDPGSTTRSRRPQTVSLLIAARRPGRHRRRQLADPAVDHPAGAAG